MNTPFIFPVGPYFRALIGAVLIAFIGAGQALAHASLVTSAPADEAVLAKAPPELSLIFDEPVSPLILKLIAPDGKDMAPGTPRLDGNRLVIATPSGIGTGSYVLSWRVISEDGHPVGGAVVFSIGQPSAGAAARAVESIDWPLRAAIWFCRILVYVGLFTGVGGAFFLAWAPHRGKSARGLIAIAGFAGIAGTILSLGLLGADALDLGIGSLAQAQVWQTAWTTSYALTAIAAVLSMLLALLTLFSPRLAVVQPLSLVAMAGVGLAIAASGHASAASPQWLMRPAVFIHAISIAFWVGALVPLTVLFTRGDAAARPVLTWFSRLIPYPLAMLLAAGIVLAVVQVRHPEALVSTAYGKVLLAKLALVAVLLGIAAINRWRLTEPALAGKARAERRLSRSMTAEIALVMAIFGCVALWRFTPPPRALVAEAPAPPVSIHIHTHQAMASLTLTPGWAGPVAASIDIVDGNLEPLPAKEISLSFSMPSAGIEPIRIAARKIDDGEWRVDTLRLPISGTWDVVIDILISDFENVRLNSVIALR